MASGSGDLAGSLTGGAAADSSARMAAIECMHTYAVVSTRRAARSGGPRARRLRAIVWSERATSEVSEGRATSEERRRPASRRHDRADEGRALGTAHHARYRPRHRGLAEHGVAHPLG